eukprot:scaffold108153_cov59-Phaeocystis_antarctica.AAC.2
MTPARPTDTTPAPSKAARCACVAAVASLSTEQADARCERGDDRLAPLEQVASDEHGRRAKVAAGRPAPEHVRSCARVRRAPLMPHALSRSIRVHGPLGRRTASGWSCVRTAMPVRRGRAAQARRHRVRRRRRRRESVPPSRKFGDGTAEVTELLV